MARNIRFRWSTDGAEERHGHIDDQEVRRSRVGPAQGSTERTRPDPAPNIQLIPPRGSRTPRRLFNRTSDDAVHHRTAQAHPRPAGARDPRRSGWLGARRRGRRCPGRATRSSAPARTGSTGRPAGGPGATRVPELLPIRYGRMAVVAVHVLPRCGAADGERPGRHAAVRAHRAGLRGRPPGQLRGVRLARSGIWCSTSTTSTRPCPGPWEWDVKRLATSLEIAGAVQRLPDEGAPRHRAGGGGGLPAGDARVRRHGRAGGLVRPRRHGPDRGRSPPRAGAAPQRKVLARTIAKARTKDNLGRAGPVRRRRTTAWRG